MFIADKSGSLQFYLEEFTKYQNPLGIENKIVVRIKNGVKNISSILEITPERFPEPVITPLEGICGQNFYLYGDGMFFYDHPRLSNDSAFDTYANRIDSDENYGSSRIMEVKKDESISYIKFGLPSVADTSIVIDGSTLHLGAFVDTKPSAKYRVGRVTSPWSENSLTWLNKPSSSFIGTYEVGTSASSGLFSIDISKAAESWLKLKQENNGVSIELTEVENLSNDIRFFTTENDFIKPRFSVGFSNPTKIPTDTLFVGNVVAGDTVFVRYENGSNKSVELFDTKLTPAIIEIIKELVGRPENLDRAYFASQPLDYEMACRPSGNRIESFQFYSTIVGDSSNVELSLEFPDGKEVWPTLRRRDGGNDSNRVNTIDFKVTMTENGEPIREHNLLVSGNVISGTGGHLHTNDFPRSSLGRFTNIATNDSYSSEAEVITDANGEVELQYTAMEFSAKLEIEVKSIDIATEIRDTINIRVPGLVEFGGVGSYILTGEETNVHEDTHYLSSQEVTDSLISASNVFAAASWNTTGVMELNDMSLKWGGIFDIGGDWDPPHGSHRLGTDVDIENAQSQDSTVTIIDPNTEQELERTVRVFEQDWISRFIELMLDKGWIFVDEGQRNPNRDNPRFYYTHFRWGGN